MVGSAGGARHARRHRARSIGPIGLLVQRCKRDPDWLDEARYGMDIAFIVMLFLTGLTGLALLDPARDGRDGHRCWRCISAWCSRCSSPCPMASSCTASIAFSALVR